MTVDNQNIEQNVDTEYENVYRGKKWSMGKILAIYTAICATMFIRDLGMVFVYGFIYDKVAVEGLLSSISLLNYALMVALFLLPMIFPFVLKLKSGAYFDEIQSPLLPSFNKGLNIVMYVVLVLALIFPVLLSMLGTFTGPYMFVAVNIALMFASGVILFYYFGTYFLQRAKVSLAVKYTLPTLLMVVSTVISLGLTVAVVFVLKLVGLPLPLLAHVDTYVASVELVQLIVPAVYMLVMVSLGAIFSGLLYHLTQNIIYAVVPTVIVAFPGVVLFQRINEATAFIAKNEKTLADYIEKGNSKAAELQASVLAENIGMIICYVLLGYLLVLMLAIGVRAIVGLAINRKESK